MRWRWSLVMVALGASPSHAQDAAAKAEHEACLAQRREIGQRAQTITDLNERTRLLQTMPQCPAPPPAAATTTAHSSLPPDVSTDYAPTQPTAAAHGAFIPPWNGTTTVSVEPFALFATALTGAFEREVQPHIGAAVILGVGYGGNVMVGDRVRTSFRGGDFNSLEEVQWGRILVGGQLNLYEQARIKGAHVGVEVAYARYDWGSQGAEAIQTFSTSVIGGWKWIRPSGFSIGVQFGLGIAAEHTGNDDAGPEPMSGWHLNRDGTLKAVHLAGNASVGYSF